MVWSRNGAPGLNASISFGEPQCIGGGRLYPVRWIKPVCFARISRCTGAWHSCPKASRRWRGHFRRRKLSDFSKPGKKLQKPFANGLLVSDRNPQPFDWRSCIWLSTSPALNQFSLHWPASPQLITSSASWISFRGLPNCFYAVVFNHFNANLGGIIGNSHVQISALSIVVGLFQRAQMPKCPANLVSVSLKVAVAAGFTPMICASSFATGLFSNTKFHFVYLQVASYKFQVCGWNARWILDIDHSLLDISSLFFKVEVKSDNR